MRAYEIPSYALARFFARPRPPRRPWWRWVLDLLAGEPG
jgi:hypothetical protein